MSGRGRDSANMDTKDLYFKNCARAGGWLLREYEHGSERGYSCEKN